MFYSQTCFYIHNQADNQRSHCISIQTVKNMTQASLLMNISNNQLQFVPNSIQNVPVISIYNNPFKCACNMTWMAGWLDLKSIKPRDKQVTSLGWIRKNLNTNTFVSYGHFFAQNKPTKTRTRRIDLKSIKPRDKQVTCRTEEGDIHNINAVSDELLDCNFYTEIGLAIGFGILLVLVLVGLFWAKKCP
jgi:hypothetical protein